MKKSQIFIIDFIFSIFILVVTLTIFFSYYYFTSYNKSVYDVNYDIVETLTTSKINNLNDEYIKELFTNKSIRNPRSTLAKQILEFKENGNEEISKNLTKKFIKDLIPNNFNTQISFLNLTSNSRYLLFNITNASKNSVDKSQTKSSIRREVYIFVNSTEEYGPYTLEVIVWQ